MPKSNLRGRIISMYNTVKNFAAVMGWSLRKTYDIVNGRQEMTAKDIDLMCEMLNVQIPEEMKSLFF